MRETNSKEKDRDTEVSHGKKENLIESNQSNQSNRCNNTFHMERSIAQAFRKYAHRHEWSLASLIEDALIKYIECNPLEEVNIEIKYLKPEQLADVQQRLEVAIMYSEIERLVEILDRIDRTGIGRYKEFQGDLVKALKPAVKLQNPPERFIELLKRAEKHLDLY